jgi:mRNA interferase MazF
MTIFQGEIYWIDLGEPQGSEPAYLRPFVVVQNDALNQSQIGYCVSINNQFETSKSYW